RVKPAGARTDLASGDARSGDPTERKSSAETAEKIGVSQATIERARAVLASDDEEAKTALRDGQTTVNGAYKAVKQAESAGVDSAEPEAAPALVITEW